MHRLKARHLRMVIAIADYGSLIRARTRTDAIKKPGGCEEILREVGDSR